MTTLLETLMATCLVGGMTVTGYAAIDAAVQDLVVPAEIAAAEKCAEYAFITNDYPTQADALQALADRTDPALEQQVVSCFVHVIGDPYDPLADLPPELLSAYDLDASSNTNK